MIIRQIWSKLFQPIIDPFDFIAIEIMFLVGSVEGSIFQLLMHMDIGTVSIHFLECMALTNIVLIISMITCNIIICCKGRNIFRPFN